KRLGLTNDPAEVLLGGGVLQDVDGDLLAAIDRGLREHAPNVTVRGTASAAIVGAALLGLDELDAGPAGQRRLRAEFEGGRVGWGSLRRGDAGLSRQRAACRRRADPRHRRR